MPRRAHGHEEEKGGNGATMGAGSSRPAHGLVLNEEILHERTQVFSGACCPCSRVVEAAWRVPTYPDRRPGVRESNVGE